MLDIASLPTKEIIQKFIPRETFEKANSWEQKFIAQVIQQQTLSKGQWSKVKDIRLKYNVRDVTENIEELTNNLYGIKK